MKDPKYSELIDLYGVNSPLELLALAKVHKSNGDKLKEFECLAVLRMKNIKIDEKDIAVPQNPNCGVKQAKALEDVVEIMNRIVAVSDRLEEAKKSIFIFACGEDVFKKEIASVISKMHMEAREKVEKIAANKPSSNPNQSDEARPLLSRAAQNNRI